MDVLLERFPLLTGRRQFKQLDHHVALFVLFDPGCGRMSSLGFPKPKRRRNLRVCCT